MFRRGTWGGVSQEKVPSSQIIVSNFSAMFDLCEWNRRRSYEHPRVKRRILTAKVSGHQALSWHLLVDCIAKASFHVLKLDTFVYRPFRRPSIQTTKRKLEYNDAHSIIRHYCRGCSTNRQGGHKILRPSITIFRKSVQTKR